MESLRRTEPDTAMHLPSAVRDTLWGEMRSAGVEGPASRDYVALFALANRYVAAQAGCSLEDATDAMLDRSVADGCSLGDLAVGVVEGRVRFDY